MAPFILYWSVINHLFLSYFLPLCVRSVFQQDSNLNSSLSAVQSALSTLEISLTSSIPTPVKERFDAIHDSLRNISTKVDQLQISPNEVFFPYLSLPSLPLSSSISAPPHAPSSSHLFLLPQPSLPPCASFNHIVPIHSTEENFSLQY